MEASNDNFVGTAIRYDSFCVDQNPETNTKELSIKVTTDLTYIIESVAAGNEGVISDDGFVILCNYVSAGLYYVELEGSALVIDVKANMHLSWANLHNRYYRHNRVLLEGYMNNILTTFWTAQKNIKQESFFAIICSADNYDPDNYITTELGEIYFSGAKAKVEQSELSPSGEIKFSLLYGPVVGSAPPPIPDEKWIFIQEDTCGHLYATLSEPADADLVIIISHEVLDSDRFFVCGGGPETWTIPMGASAANLGITVCGGGIPSGGCINYAWNFTAITGWIINTQTKCEC